MDGGKIEAWLNEENKVLMYRKGGSEYIFEEEGEADPEVNNSDLIIRSFVPWKEWPSKKVGKLSSPISVPHTLMDTIEVTNFFPALYDLYFNFVVLHRVIITFGLLTPEFYDNVE